MIIHFKLKNPSQLLLKLIIILYSFLLTYCNYENDEYTYYENSIHNEKSRLISELKSKYNGKTLVDTTDKFTLNYQSKLLEKIVVIDTVIKGLEEKDGVYFLQAKITSDTSFFLIVNVECNRDLFQKIKRFKNPGALMVVAISKIDKLSFQTEIESIDKEHNLMRDDQAIILKGICLDIYKHPSPLDEIGELN